MRQAPPRTGGMPGRIAWGLWVAAIAFILLHVWLKPNSNTLYKVFRAGGARWLASENLYPKVDEYIYSPVDVFPTNTPHSAVQSNP